MNDRTITVFDDTEEDPGEEFHGGCLVYDENGAGSLDMTIDFLEESAIARADILRDWLYQLMGLYTEAVSDLHRPPEPAEVPEKH